MSKYNKTLTITVILSFFLICLIISAGSSPVLDNLENHDDNPILLKNAIIDTSIKQQSKAAANIAISQNQAVDDDGYYLVQFKGYTKEEWKQALRDSGAVLYDYVPNNAFIARMNSSVKSQVEALDSVKWVGIYRSEYRISPALSSSNAIMGRGGANENITVLLFDAGENKRVSGEITGLGGEIVSNSGDRIRVNIAKTKIPDVAQINGVSWIEKYVKPVIMNDVAANITETYSVRNTHGLTGAGQIVAVADTGLDTGVNDNTMHADIRGRVKALIDLSNNGASDIFSGHGTHVAGSVLGNGTQSGGQFTGMAPEAELVFQAIENSDRSLNGLPSDLNILFQQAYDQGARIHSNSWGHRNLNGVYYYDSKDTDNFVWFHPDMLILFAAGNEGIDGNSNGIIDQDSISPPATAKNALSVGASENYRGATFIKYPYLTYGISWFADYPSDPINGDYMANNFEGLAAFSSRGPTDDGRIKPDVVAPGTFVISTRSSATNQSLWGEYNPSYVYSGGTSMSTPVVAGIAALVRQYYVQDKNITPSAALLKATIINGAHIMTPGQYGTGATQEIQTRPDFAQGWGRVDVENSLFPASPRTMRYHDISTGLSTSDYWNINYNMSDSSQPFRVTLVWSDYPGVPYAGITLVNNLDLTVTGPSGIYYGNGAPDNRNNVEEVELISPPSGSYIITIKGTNIPQGPQPFALVISGALDFLPPTSSNEFPTNNSYTNNNTTNVSVSITDSVSGVNLSSINMTINGSPVTFSNTPISNGFRIQNVTTVPFGDGRVYVSINATNNDSELLEYPWSFIVDTQAPQVAINPVSYQNGTSAKTGSIIEFNISAYDPIINSTSSGLKNASVNVSLINNTGIIALANDSVFWKGNVTIDKSSILDGNYLQTVSFSDNAGNINSSEQINISIDNTPPSVTGVSVSPSVINLTGLINITANITSPDQFSQVNRSDINARITYPNGTSIDYPMFNGSGDLFYMNFSDTAQYGLYDVTILANDTAGNMNSTQRTHFTAARISNLEINLTGANSETFTAAYSNTTLSLYTNNSSNGTIQISQSKVNLTSNVPDFSSPGIYVLVNASPGILNDLAYVVLSVNYTDADVSSFVESSLRLYRWNTTSSEWEKLSGPGLPSFVNDAGVDTVSNYVWANITKLSEFAMGGDLYTPPARQIPSSGGGGGGGGGGGASGENYTNIEVVEKYDLSIYKDKVTSYRFTSNNNPVMFVNVTGNVSFGDITTSIEVLKSNSTMVNIQPYDIVYKNVNIWVGSSSFNRPENIKEGIISFKVLNSWLENNSITNTKMVMWDGSDWKELATNEIAKDSTYTYYDASTRKFANFAITGTKGQTSVRISSPLSFIKAKPIESALPIADSTKKAPGFEISTLLLLCYLFFLFRQQGK